MTVWARLTWQAADPATLARAIGVALGVEAVADERATGTFVVGFGGAELEFVPWRREAPTDEPLADGRLVFEPATLDVPERPLIQLPALVLAGVGWATVELDRAEAELAEWLDGEPAEPDDDGVEPHLGGRARVRATTGLPGDALVLLEPATEGRLAASLARDGEGPCALYLWPPAGLDAWVDAARRRGTILGARADGPFGASVLVPVGGTDAPSGPAGPHLLVVRDPPAAAGTIGA